ncbi:class I SAM-dependent methyltransferase [Lachnospiraceae bacterium 45-W7]
MLQLSKRLQAVASLVGEAEVLADVGTDHGYIPVYLLASGKVKRGIAMDINQGPLMRARTHIRQYGVDEMMETRLSDGLAALEPGEADVIVIAGMGGSLMMRILSQGEASAHAARRLVLQPQSEIYAFRTSLLEQGYEIEAEEMVYEEGKYYSMMAAEYVGMEGKAAQSESLSETELKYGPLLIEKRHPVLRQYLQYQWEQKEKIRIRLVENARQDVSRRKEEIGRELAEIEKLLALWKEQVV